MLNSQTDRVSCLNYNWKRRNSADDLWKMASLAEFLLMQIVKVCQSSNNCEDSGSDILDRSIETSGNN